MANTNSTTHEVLRPLVNFPQDIWGDHLLSFPANSSDLELYSKEVEALKEMVKVMLVATSDGVEKLNLIYSLYRLGVSYHFENKIEEDLNHLFISVPKLIDDNDYDLHTVAVIFQVFRLHGYKMLSDVFSKFRDGDGKFKEELKDNVSGIISLYEATHLRMTGEAILDEALAFTTKNQQESIADDQSNHLPPYLTRRINNALFRPYHHSMQRIEARQYISFYEQDESRNYVLLKFAKCDFNRVQLLYQQELSVLSSWYEELNMKSKFPYARHRPVEALFYAVGVYFEPRYARARNIVSKHVILIGFLDDSYEAYGLFEELKYFTDAIQRFDIISSMDALPANYLKTLYETILYVHDEAEDEVREEGRSYSVSYTRDEVKKYAIAEHVEARWRHEGYVPTFDEYLDNGLFSSAGRLALTQIMIGMEEADKNSYEWVINSGNNFTKNIQISTRLYNDIVTNEDEDERGFSTSWTCYMKQHNVSREEAVKAFREKLEMAWKVINEGLMKPTPVPHQILRAALNYQRMLDFAYKYNDDYTKQEIAFKRLIPQVLLHPIPL